MGFGGHLKVNMMKKQEIIDSIQKVVRQWGEFSTADVHAGTSSIYGQMGKDHVQLMERFNMDDVEVVTYVHETETDEFTIAYDELVVDQLEEILLLAEDYDALMEQTIKRCSSY